ncbi:hypothetical protein [Devosia sp.]|nr:hypothetical protein [Devosia sp.]
MRTWRALFLALLAAGLALVLLLPADLRAGGGTRPTPSPAQVAPQ